MEIVLLIITIVSVVVAAHYRSSASAHLRFILKQDEQIKYLQSEQKEWQNKALQRQGLSPLGTDRKPPKPKEAENILITPTIVHRGQLEARVKQDKEQPQTTAVTINANGVSYPTVKREVLEKAEEIINATR